MCSYSNGSHSAVICTYGDGLHSMVDMAMEPGDNLIACVLRPQQRHAESPRVQYSRPYPDQTYETLGGCVRRVGRETFARIVDMPYCSGFYHEQYGLA